MGGTFSLELMGEFSLPPRQRDVRDGGQSRAMQLSSSCHTLAGGVKEISLETAALTMKVRKLKKINVCQCVQASRELPQLS